MTEAETQILAEDDGSTPGAAPPATSDTAPARSGAPHPGDSAPEAPPAATSPAIDNALPEDRYLNRELSWLDFNARVLALAADPSLPLLERAKFLAIFASNLDEFYMVRVAGLKRRDEMGLSVRSADGLSPREQLRRINERTQQMASRHAHVFLDCSAAGARRRGDRDRHVGRTRRGRALTVVDVFPRAGVPGVDAAGGRSGTPLPVRERPESEPRSHRQAPRGRRSALCANQGGRQRRPLRRAGAARGFVRCGAVPPDWRN